MVTGERRNLTQVDRGSQYSMAVQVADLRMTRRLKAAAALLERFDYAGVLLTLESLARSPVSQDQQAALRRKIAICRAFDAWDRFDHQTAKHILEPYKGEFEAHYRFLRCLIGEAPPNAIARAEDLLLNVERRRTQARFDDAIARLYRCMELAAQIVLRFAHRIDTSALQLDQLPMEFRSNLSAEQTHKIGLIKSYELLLALESPLGFWYSKSRAQLLAWLETRNASILAHGSEPIGEQKYEDVGNLGYKLCREALDVAEKLFELPVPPTQLPAALPGLP